MMKASYEEICDIFKSRKCKLITTKTTFKNKDITIKRGKVKYITSCGHIREITIGDFKNKKIGDLCHSCSYQHTSDTYKQRENLAHTNLHIETLTFNILQRALRDTFEVKRVYEGCLYDAIIRPHQTTTNPELQDLWLPIQLKGSVFDKRGNVRFRHVNGYNNIALVCIALDSPQTPTRNTIWAMNGNQVSHIQGLTTRPDSGKYMSYQVAEQDLASTLDTFYHANDFTKTNEDYAMTPITLNCQKEHEYRTRRLKAVNGFFDIKYPDEASAVYDCFIQGYKVQDKLGHITHNNGYKFGIRKSNRQKHVPYDQGDNDFYWLHIPNSSKFFVIPEHILITHNYIHTSTQSGKQTLVLYPDTQSYEHNTHWAKDYLYDYDDSHSLRRLRILMK